MKPPEHAMESLIERAAIMEFDGGMEREAALVAAWGCTACPTCPHWSGKVCQYGCDMRDCVMLGDDAGEVWRDAIS